MAVALRESSTKSRTRIAAAAIDRKSDWGCVAHDRICSGSTVNDEPGFDGMNVIKTTPEIIRIGAASPIARDRARMMPLMIPGTACGSTTVFTTCQRVAPIAYAASR